MKENRIEENEQVTSPKSEEVRPEFLMVKTSIKAGSDPTPITVSGG